MGSIRFYIESPFGFVFFSGRQGWAGDKSGLILATGQQPGIVIFEALRQGVPKCKHPRKDVCVPETFWRNGISIRGWQRVFWSRGCRSWNGLWKCGDITNGNITATIESAKFRTRVQELSPGRGMACTHRDELQ